MEDAPETEASTTATPDPERDAVVTDGAPAVPATLPVATTEAIETLFSILTDEPDTTEAAAPEAAADASTEPAPGATVTTITEEDSRSSSEEFSQPSTEGARDDDGGLTTLQKVGLVALGALAVGAILNARGDQVVENSGDRVVVDPRGHVSINGKAISEPYVQTFCPVDSQGIGPCRTLDTVVPPGAVLALGDNRANSWDGRFWPGGPFLPRSEIIGRAFYRFWPLNRTGPLGDPDPLIGGPAKAPATAPSPAPAP
jgi:hypothetical protein